MADEPITLEEAFDKASSTLQINEKSEPEEKVEPEVPEKTEQPEPAEKAEPETPEKPTESDLESIDPKSIPPELKPKYDELMRGFTKGRQKDSEARKQAEARAAEYEAKVKEYESKSKGDNFSELTPDELQRLTPAEQAQYFSALTDFKATEAVKNSKIEDYRLQALNDYESADIRLTRPTEDKPNEKYDHFLDSAIGAELDVELDKYAREHGSELGFPHKERTLELIKEYDEEMKARYGAYIKDQNEKLKESEAKAQKTSPKTSTAKATPSKPSLEQALKMAQEKMGL